MKITLSMAMKWISSIEFTKKGWRSTTYPSVHTTHYGGRSLNRWQRREKVYAGKMRFYQKHYGPHVPGCFG